jgi:hypothetical protein
MRRAWIGGMTAALIGLLGAAEAGAALRIASPANGATVREKVRVSISRSAVPTNGFVALYVDGRFVMAQSPPRNPSQPISLVWNTKEKLAETSGGEQPEIKDGRHTIEVRTYNNAGDLVERAQVAVLVDNNLEVRSGQPVSLAYKFRVGDTTAYNHRVEIEAAPTSGAGSVAPGTSGQLKLVENATFKVFIEDFVGGEAFVRERKNSPVIVSVNEQRQPVPVDESSRYYDMDVQGNVGRTKAMERDRRQPIVNTIRLPGRSVRVGETWTAPVRIALGNFVPEQIVVSGATNKLEGVVWSNGRPAARIVSTYEGTAKLSLVSMGVPTGDYKYKGKSVILFAPSLGKVLRATHELEGDLTIDLLQQQLNQTGPGSGGFAPSLGGGYGPPGLGGPPGGIPGGYGSPGGYGPPGASGPGAPPGGGGYPGGYGAPGGYPGGYGAPGGGYGAPGAYDPSGYGGSVAPQTTQTYKTKVSVTLAVPA